MKKLWPRQNRGAEKGWLRNFIFIFFIEIFFNIYIYIYFFFGQHCFCYNVAIFVFFLPVYSVRCYSGVAKFRRVAKLLVVAKFSGFY